MTSGAVMSWRQHFASTYLGLAVLAAALGGCATTPPAQDTENDPYEPFNRKMFALNEKLDRNFAEPVAKFYTRAVPEPARSAVHNILSNLGEPVTLANDILQGEPVRGSRTLGRIVVNTTFGLAGIVDLATPMGIPGHTEDFGETLAVYGVHEGPFLMLPFFGPSNPRDAGGALVDIGFDPLTYMGLPNKTWWTSGRAAAGILDDRAQNLDTLDEIRRSSVDLYATLRSLYRQHRDAEIRHGKPDLQNLPNI
jgi:phospholipid-binding lipoprotein MlaA